MKRLGIGAIAVAALASLLSATGAAASVGHGERPDATYRVTVTNTTDGQYLTPPNFAVHEPGVRIFRRGQVASPGVQAVAENGGVPVLAAEIAGAVDDAGLGDSTVGGDAPLPPGAEVTFELGSSERRLSIVSMLICTNDGFAGLDSRNIGRLAIGESSSFGLRAYDARTNINTHIHTTHLPTPTPSRGKCFYYFICVHRLVILFPYTTL